MLPTDNDFIALYGLYLLLYLYMFNLLLFHKRLSKKFLISLLIVSLGMNSLLFSNPQIFKYGGAIAVLFYAFFLFIVKVIILLVMHFIANTRKNK